MTFSSGKKKGKQNKRITIESNDPKNPKTTIYVLAFIEVEFGFDLRALNFGDVNPDDTVTKNTFVIVKDPSTMWITDLTSSSPLIKARQVSPSASEGDLPKIEVEVTIFPGLPPGRINYVVTAHSNLESTPSATMNVFGNVKGYIEVSPEALRFDVKPIEGEDTSPFQKFQLINRSPEDEFQILSVSDPTGRIKLDYTTLQNGQRYEFNANLVEDSLGEGTWWRGAINIVTDHPKQDTVVVDYNVYSR